MEANNLIIDEKEYPGNPADPELLPHSTYWPVALAFGLLLSLWGIITSLIVTGVGAVCFAVALAGWITELNHE